MGSTELESVTSCVSSRRSNQLSYEPKNLCKPNTSTRNSLILRQCQGSALAN